MFWAAIVAAAVVMSAATLAVPASSSAAIDDLPGTWVSQPTVVTNGRVNAMVRHPAGDIIIAGLFNQVCEPDTGRCITVGNIAVLSAPNRLARSIGDTFVRPPSTDGEVYALAVTGSDRRNAVVWVGGRFVNVDSHLRKGLFGFSLQSMAVVSFDPFANAKRQSNGMPVVNALAVGQEQRTGNLVRQELYVGGDFSVYFKPACVKDAFEAQKNLANITVGAYGDGRLVGTYNHRWMATASKPVTALAAVPAGRWGPGLLVATRDGVRYGRAAVNGAGHGPVALVTGPTGVPHSWRPRIEVDRTATGAQYIALDELAARKGLAAYVAGRFIATRTWQRSVLGRLDSAGELSPGFHVPSTGGSLPGAVALAGQVETQPEDRRARWLLRGVGTRVEVRNAATGEVKSTFGVRLAGLGTIRSILAAPGFGVMVAGEFGTEQGDVANLALFKWPAGQEDRQVKRATAGSDKRGTGARARSAGVTSAAPKMVVGKRVRAITEYPGGVAIGGDLEKVCTPPTGGDAQGRVSCDQVGDVVALSDDGKVLKWNARVRPQGTVAALEWVNATRTLLVGGAFQTVGDGKERGGLAELAIPFGEMTGEPAVTAMKWLDRGTDARETNFSRRPIPGRQAVLDIDYDDVTQDTTVVGNFATNPLYDGSRKCANGTRRVAQFTDAMQPSPDFDLKLGDEETVSEVWAIASFMYLLPQHALRGYVIGGTFQGVEVGGSTFPYARLLVAGANGTPFAANLTDGRIGAIHQLSEVRDAQGRTVTVAGIADDPDDDSVPKRRVVILMHAASAGGSPQISVREVPLFEFRRLTAIAGAPDGSFYIAGTPLLSSGPQIVRVSTDATASVDVLAEGSSGEITRLLLSRDGRYLYAGGTFKGLRIDRTTTRDLFAPIKLRP
jgi:hypothetical protein